MIVVSNATPLIALSKLDRLALLRDLFGAIHIPQAVYEEVVVRAPNRPGLRRSARRSGFTYVRRRT